MFKNLFSKKQEGSVAKIAEKQLKRNRAVIESLRDYDTGKKDIPTRDVERRLRDIRVSP